MMANPLEVVPGNGARPLPVFSVVIPTRRRSEALRRALHSILSQSADSGSYEAIVVENDQNPSCRDLVEQMAQSTLVSLRYALQPLPGAHSARNLGAELARGDYLVFIDDDCTVCEEYIEAYSDAFEGLLVSIAGGPISVVWDSDPGPEIRHFEYLMGRIDLGESVRWLESGCSVNGGNMVVRRDEYLALGGMAPDQFGRFIWGSGDTGLCRRMVERGARILWAPGARACHWQMRAINGTPGDLFRRHFNNGICAGYEWMRPRKRGLTVLLAFQIGRMLRRLLIDAAKTLIARDRVGRRKRILEVGFDLGYLIYLFGHGRRR